MRHWKSYSAATAALVFGGAACADWDNPTALDQLLPDVEIELEAARVETYQEIEIHVHATEGGMPMEMREAQLQIERHDGTEPQIIPLGMEGDGFAAHVRFFDPGEHHVHFMGLLRRHQFMHEFGEVEVEANRLHQMIGPYWVEIELSPGRVLPGEEAHVHLFAFTVGADGLPDQPASGLDMHLEMHDLGGGARQLAALEEGLGEYETSYQFGAAGIYELHVAIDLGGVEADNEFQLPIVDPAVEEEHDEEGDGHGHVH